MHIAEPKALIDFRIDPKFGPLPQSDTSVERDVCGLTALAATRQAVWSRIGRADRRVGLFGKGGLTMEI